MSEFESRNHDFDQQIESKEKNKRIIGRITLLRHGQTKYTDQYPDLTELGQETIIKSAEQIALGLNSEEDLKILSSPNIRAQGTAGIIKEAIKHEDEIKIQPSLEMNRIRDKKGAQALWDDMKAEMSKDEHESGSIDAIDYAYTHDPRFEDAEIFEPRSEIEKRFFTNLEYSIRAFEVVAKHPEIPKPHLIAVSHFELLNHFVQKVFELKHPQDLTLRHGELIEIYIVESAEDKENKMATLEVGFRGQQKTIKFDRNTRTIIL